MWLFEPSRFAPLRTESKEDGLIANTCELACVDIVLAARRFAALYRTLRSRPERVCEVLAVGLEFLKIAEMVRSYRVVRVSAFVLNKTDNRGLHVPTTDSKTQRAVSIPVRAVVMQHKTRDGLCSEERRDRLDFRSSALNERGSME